MYRSYRIKFVYLLLPGLSTKSHQQLLLNEMGKIQQRQNKEQKLRREDYEYYKINRRS